ncbi:MAG: dihydrodipicolinate synthase family protein [Rhodospirillaceae bacterium]
MNYRKSEAKAASRAQFRGVWAAIHTPFTSDCRLDETGLRRNMRHYTDALAVDGIFCAGTMGEFWALTKEERKRVVEIVVEEARGKCRVIAHTGHHSPDETVDLTNHAAKAGADFVVVINPYYPIADDARDEAIYQWFAYVSARTDIGIWMFDTPFSWVSLSAEVTARIATLENVCGIKVSRPLDHYAKVNELCGDQIVLSHPSETEFLHLMRSHGMKVHMSSAAPFLMQVAGFTPMRDYAELALQGKFDAAQAIRDGIQPLREVHEQWLREPWLKRKIIPIAHLKCWAQLIGLAAGPVRPPLLQLTAAERDALRADLTRVGLLGRLAEGANAA